MAKWQKNPDTDEFEMVNEHPPPDEIYEFRKYRTHTEQITMPELPHKRKCTDVVFAIIFAIFLIVTIALIIVNAPEMDIHKLSNGYDPYGNICGEENQMINGDENTGQDFRDKPYLLFNEKVSYGTYKRYTDIEKQDKILYLEAVECVETCPYSHHLVNNRCYPTKYEEHDWNFIFDVLKKSIPSLVVMTIYAIVISIAILVGFRMHVRTTSLFLIFFGVLSTFGIGIFFLIMYTSQDGYTRGYVITGGCFIALGFLELLMVYCFWSNMPIVFALFEETVNIIFCMKVILLQPLVTLLANVSLLIGVYYGFLGLISVGKFEPVESKHDYFNDYYIHYEYHLSGIAIGAMIMLAIMTIWMLFFIWGCEIFIIGYSTVAIYFRKNRTHGTSPLCTAYYILVRFHLGTIACGSLIVTIMQIIKSIIENALERNQEDAGVCFAILASCIECCLALIQDLLEYFTKNAFIESAIHGRPFCTSGIRAFRLFAHNFMNCITVNAIGDYILASACILIMLTSALLCYLINLVQGIKEVMDFFYIPMVFGIIFVGIVTKSVFGLFETVIDAVFLCFCEDKLLNDGTTRPYFMSPKLRQFVDNAFEYEKQQMQDKRKSCC